MSVIKVNFIKHCKNLEKYLKKEEGRIVMCTGTIPPCSPENHIFHKEFSEHQKQHNWRGNQAIHVIQSFSHEESKILGKEGVLNKGVELATQMYEDHSVMIVTHVNSKHLHNHLMINPVSFCGTKRIHNKLHHRDLIVSTNDNISRKHGLEVIIPDPKNRLKDIHKTMVRNGRFSYVDDLREKAMFAQKYARNFHEHKYIMNQFKIHTRVGQKTISYRHPAAKKAKRSYRLDESLDYHRIFQTFNKNREKYLNDSLIDLLNNDPKFFELKAKDILINDELKRIRKSKISDLKEKDILSNSKKYIISKKFDGILVVDDKNRSFIINETAKEFKTIEILAKNQKREFIKNRFMDNAVTYVKSNKLDGIIAVNEKGKTFLIKSFDSEFHAVELKALEQLKQFKKDKFTSIINDRTKINHYRNKAKIHVINSKGESAWINPIDHKELFKSLKLEEHFSIRNTTKYFINSNARRNRLISNKSLKGKLKLRNDNLLKQDIRNIEKIQKTGGFTNLKMIEYRNIKYSDARKSIEKSVKQILSNQIKL